MRIFSVIVWMCLAALVAPANAALVEVSATLLTGTSPESGNDKLADVNTFLSGLSKDDTGFLGKWDVVDSGGQSATNGDLSPIGDFFTVVYNTFEGSRDLRSGRINFNVGGSGKTFDYFTIKSANQFAVYEVDGNPSMGYILFDTLSASLTNNKGNAQDVSHISFFGVDGTHVPLPAAAFLFPAGLGLFAAMKRLTIRRREGATA